MYLPRPLFATSFVFSHRKPVIIFNLDSTLKHTYDSTTRLIHQQEDKMSHSLKSILK
ncbi:hypothetical protein M426DRAFT_321413 [Hypoxylon sp. CI-4A]|nr:hypothetical protein M426DRAFT_321413 [Hypoxylon sp. CI-4A]